MKSASIASPLGLNIWIFALLFAAVVFVVISGMKVPLISNVRIAMLVLLVLGMTMCAIGGIGRMAAAGQWTHPLSILGYLLGALILIIGLATIFGVKLPYIQSDAQAITVVASLTAAKVVNTAIHHFIWPGA